MSDAEKFAVRWSRLKRETAKGEPAKSKSRDAAPPPEREDHLEGRGDTDAPRPSDLAQKPPFDPATLPSIDSIVAGTDIRDFLKSGVPAELTKAALRKAWLADPAIRNFIEMAENQWDFTDPDSIPGFGPMRANDDIGELVKQAMGKLPQPVEPPPPTADVPEVSKIGTPEIVTAQAPGIPEGSADHGVQLEPVKDQAETAFAATQHVDPPIASGLSNRRGHGRAVPK